MKRTVLSLFILVFAGSACFCRQVSAQSVINREEVKTLGATGTVTLLIIGNFEKGLKSQISISSEFMGNLSFSISEDTVITGKNGEEIQISDIRKGNEVRITYTMGKRVNRAQSISLIK
jgi:hypothetical protein